MPENDSTLRDILQGFNSMQARLGLTPGASQATGIQPINTPTIKHPGEISQEMSMRMQQQVQATAMQVQQIRMLQPPNVMAFMPPGGLGGGIPAGQDFARQYQERMGQIQAGYQQPFQAQQMAQQMGMPGFQGLPSPVFMTPPSMGVFRPGMMPPPPIAMARTPPMIQTPFTPQLPAPMFQTPLQMQQAQWQQESNEMFAGTMAGIPTAARIGVGIGGMAAGAAFGRRMGGGGALGMVGAGLGAIGGGLLGFGPMGGLAERGAGAALQPAIERRAFGLQMQDISRNFVVSGPELAEGGRGLSMQAGIQTANLMRRAVGRGETAGFNMRDMMGITSMAGDMGMMDMAQNSEQIVQQGKNIARGLSAFMRLANEPDVRRAMQQMSQMRAMGLTVPETTAAMQNAQQFARMAGTTVASLGESAGMPGAMTFQRLGMTGGLGMQVGMAGGAMARQAVAGGAFTPGQLAMAGGVSGVGQQLTEAAGAGLGVTFPMMAALTRNTQGQLSLDPERVRGLAGGQYTLTQQAQMAQQNVERLGGERVITELSTRLNELRDQMGRMLGPQGSVLYTLQQGLQMQRELGGPGVMGIGGALRALGLDPQQARTMEVMAQSPQFWRNMHQQMQQQIDDARAEEATSRARRSEATSLTSQMQRGLRPVGRAFERMGEMIGGAYEDVSQWWSTRNQRQDAARRGAGFVRQSDRLRVTDENVNRRIDEMIRGGGFERYQTRTQGAFARQQEVMDAMNRMGLGTGALGFGEGGDIAGAFGANLLTGGLASLVGVGEPGLATSEVQGAIATGGMAGNIARWAPNMTWAIMQIPGVAEKWRRRGQEAARSAQTIQQGTQMSKNTAMRLVSEGSRSFKAFTKAYGGDPKASFTQAKEDAVRGVRAELRDRAHWYGNKALGDTDARERVTKELAKSMGDTAAREFMRTNGDTFMPQVMRDVHRSATDEESAVLADTEAAGGQRGVVAAENLRGVVDALERQEEAAKEMMGFYDGLDATEESFKTVSNIVMNSTEEESLALQALALESAEGSWLDPTSKAKAGMQQAAGKNLKDRLIALVGSDEKAGQLMEKMRDRFAGMEGDTKDMLRRLGMNSVTKKDPKKAMTELQQGLIGRRGQQQIAVGAARIAEDVEALNQLAKTGLGKGGFKEENIMSAMQNILDSPRQMEALRKASPQAAAAVRAFAEAGQDQEARSRAAREFQVALAQRGRKERGEMELGGRGVGGGREEALKEEMGTAERMAAQLTGNAQEDFARTIPLFSKATAKLSEASDKMERAMEAMAMANKMRPPR